MHYWWNARACFNLFLFSTLWTSSHVMTIYYLFIFLSFNFCLKRIAFSGLKLLNYVCISKVFNLKHFSCAGVHVCVSSRVVRGRLWESVLLFHCGSPERGSPGWVQVPLPHWVISLVPGALSCAGFWFLTCFFYNMRDWIQGTSLKLGKCPANPVF